MPFYRINGLTVHMRGTKLPAPCRAKVGFSSLHAEAYCLAMSAFLCDWPVGDGKTCDMPLCDAHSGQVGPNKNYCPDHLLRHRNPQQRGLFTSLVQS